MRQCLTFEQGLRAKQGSKARAVSRQASCIETKMPASSTFAQKKHRDPCSNILEPKANMDSEWVDVQG